MKNFLLSAAAAVAAAAASAGPLIHVAGGKPARDEYVAAWGVRAEDFGRRFASDGEIEVEAIATGVPCAIAHAGETASASVQFRNVSKRELAFTARWYRIDDTLETTGDDIFAISLKRLAEEKVGECEIRLAPGAAAVREVEPRLPDAFGSSALVVERSDTGTRLLAAHFARIDDPGTERGLHRYRICMDISDPAAVSRLKTAPNRIGVPMRFADEKGCLDERRRVDERLAALAKTGYPVCVEFGAGDAVSPAQPLGRSRPHLSPDGTLLETKSDFAWLPERDGEFKAYVKELVKKHGYPHGAVNGVMLWNEPWNGISISGWGADEIRYREMYEKMAEAVEEARTEDPALEMMIGGCDSSSNTFDMLFSDGDMKFLKWLDFMSLHYQGLSPSNPRFLREREGRWGRTLFWDTESWAANSPERVPGVLAGMLAAGHDRMVGIQGEAVVATAYDVDVYDAAGRRTERRRAYRAWPTAPALAAFQKHVGNREFDRILFQGLPWVYLFRGANAGDVTAVVCGDIAPVFDGKGKKGLVPFWTAHEGREVYSGVMRLAGAASLKVYDGNGNAVASGADEIAIPLSDRGFYVRGDGTAESARRLVAALEGARVEGMPLVAPAMRDSVAPIGGGAVFRAELRNISNRPLSGVFEATAEGLVIEYANAVEIPVGETAVVPMKVEGGAANDANEYPFRMKFTASTGEETEWRETLRVNVIAEARRFRADGFPDLSGAPVQRIAKGGGGATQMERAWLPMVAHGGEDAGAGAGVDGDAEIRLGADDRFFYVSAKVRDATVDEGMPRFATWDEDEYFYPEESFERDMEKCRATIMGGTSVRLPLGGGKVWTTNVRWMAFDFDAPPGGARVALLLADDDDMVRRDYEFVVTGSDGEERRFTANPQIDRSWVRFNVPGGRVNVAFGMRPWRGWLKPKVGAVAIDAPEPGLEGAAVEKDVGAGFSLSYGSAALHVAGDALPAWRGETVGRTLKWPSGVRRYTYRRRPELPQGGQPPHDNVQIAFNVLSDLEKPWLPAAPGAFKTYSAYWDSDYCFDLNPVAERYGGGTEIWIERAPWLPDKHFFPRSPKHPKEGPVEGGRLAIRREGGLRLVDAAIPWTAMPEVKAARDAGRTVKFTCRVNDDADANACTELTRNRSAAKRNESFKPAWKEHWSNEIEFGW